MVFFSDSRRNFQYTFLLQNTIPTHYIEKQIRFYEKVEFYSISEQISSGLQTLAGRMDKTELFHKTVEQFWNTSVSWSKGYW